MGFFSSCEAPAVIARDAGAEGGSCRHVAAEAANDGRPRDPFSALPSWPRSLPRGRTPTSDSAAAAGAEAPAGRPAAAAAPPATRAVTAIRCILQFWYCSWRSSSLSHSFYDHCQVAWV